MKGPESKNPDGRPTTTAWQRQFPIDTAEEAKQTRRQFVAGAAVAGGAMACGQLGLHLVAPAATAGQLTEHEPLDVGAADDVSPGDARMFHFPDEHTPCLLIRTADRIFAYTQKCTHLACPVVPDVEQGTLDCPCHKGAFSLTDGMPLSGPPRTGLSEVVIEERDGRLVATGIRTPGVG